MRPSAALRHKPKRTRLMESGLEGSSAAKDQFVRRVPVLLPDFLHLATTSADAYRDPVAHRRGVAACVFWLCFFGLSKTLRWWSAPTVRRCTSAAVSPRGSS